MPHNLSYITVDDEPQIHEMLKLTLSKYKNLIHVNRFSKGYDVLEFLNSQKCDLMFLDIKMQDISGFQLLELIDDPPFTVIVTGEYLSYALQAHKYYYTKNVIGFVTKPISPSDIELIIKNVNKLYELNNLNNNIQKSFSASHSGIIYAYKKENGKKLSVSIIAKEILYIEKFGNDAFIYTIDGQRFETPDTLFRLRNILPQDISMQISKSCIIMLNNLVFIEGQTVCMGKDNTGKDILLRVSYKNVNMLIKRFKRMSLK